MRDVSPAAAYRRLVRTPSRDRSHERRSRCRLCERLQGVRDSLDDFVGTVSELVGEPVVLRDVLQRQDTVLETVIRVANRDGETFVAKRGRSSLRDDPAPDPKSAWAFFNEWASLQLLGEVCPGIAPQLVAADDSAGVLLMEDFGDGGLTLPAVLRGRDRTKAEEALLAWTRTVAAMHAATASATGRYRALRDSLSAGGVLDGYLDLDGARDGFAAACANLGLTLPRETPHVFASIPSALTHGDLGGGNELIAERVTLIDFEVAGLADPMIDAAVLRMLLEQGEADYALPDDVVAELEREYARVAPMPPDAYERGCAYLFCMEFGCTYARSDPSAADVAKTAHRARMFIDLHDRGGKLDGVRSVADAVAADDLPIWPALAQATRFQVTEIDGSGSSTPHRTCERERHLWS